MKSSFVVHCSGCGQLLDRFAHNIYRYKCRNCGTLGRLASSERTATVISEDTRDLVKMLNQAMSISFYTRIRHKVSPENVIVAELIAALQDYLAKHNVFLELDDETGEYRPINASSIHELALRLETIIANPQNWPASVVTSASDEHVKIYRYLGQLGDKKIG